MTPISRSFARLGLPIALFGLGVALLSAEQNAGIACGIIVWSFAFATMWAGDDTSDQRQDPARQQGESAVRSRESTSGSTTRPVACGCFPAIGLRQVSRARVVTAVTGLHPRIPGGLRFGRVARRPGRAELERYLRFDEDALWPACRALEDAELLEHQQCALRECCEG